MPALHGLHVHTFHVAHAGLRPRLYIGPSNHPYGALQRTFKLELEGETLVWAEVWWENITSGKERARGKGKICTPDSAETELVKAKGKGLLMAEAKVEGRGANEAR